MMTTLCSPYVIVLRYCRKNFRHGSIRDRKHQTQSPPQHQCTISRARNHSPSYINGCFLHRHAVPSNEESRGETMEKLQTSARCEFWETSSLSWWNLPTGPKRWQCHKASTNRRRFCLCPSGVNAMYSVFSSNLWIFGNFMELHGTSIFSISHQCNLTCDTDKAEPALWNATRLRSQEACVTSMAQEFNTSMIIDGSVDLSLHLVPRAKSIQYLWYNHFIILSSFLIISIILIMP